MQQNLAKIEGRLFRAMEDFVNTGDSSAEWSRLRKWWPDLLPTEVYDCPFDRVRTLNQRFSGTNFRDRPGFGHDFLAPGIGYHAKPDGTVFFFLDALELRDQVRRIWRDAQTANDLLPTTFSIRLGGDPLSTALGLEEEKSDSILFGYSSNQKETRKLSSLMGSFTLRVDWARTSLVPEFETEFQRACYVLLKHSRRAKFCQNPECPAPYFIARRAIQKYCHPDCLRPIQRKSKLDWWNRVGRNQRKRNNLKSRDSAPKRKGE